MTNSRNQQLGNNNFQTLRLNSELRIAMLMGLVEQEAQALRVVKLALDVDNTNSLNGDTNSATMLV